MSKILLTGGTGFIGSHTAVELINAGFDDYLPKPINISELEYMIKQYITPTGHGDTGDD